MVEYRRLDVYEREDVALGLAQGRSQREIAAWLGRAPSTICREIRRNTEYGEHYRARMPKVVVMDYRIQPARSGNWILMSR